MSNPVALGKFQKVMLMIVAFLLMVPLAGYLIEMFTIPLILGIAGLLFIFFAPKVQVQVVDKKTGAPKKKKKRKKMFMLFGLIILAVGALEYFNILIIPLSMDIVHFILAGIGILLVLFSVGFEKKLSSELALREAQFA